MFEAQVAYYLNAYLGKYLHGLDAESLKISVWKGDVELRNLTLKPEALQDLELPITVRAGLLGRLTLKVPWARLGREPVVVEFDRLYILAGPRKDSDASLPQDMQAFVEQAEAAEKAAKAQRVDAAEQTWLQGLSARAATAAAGQAGTGAASDSKDANATAAGTSKLRFPSIQSIIDPILANLQLVISNVHVRYEDEQAWSAHSLALGVLMSRIAAVTINAAGDPAWITSSLQALLRKAITLSNLAVYLDVDRPVFVLPRGYAQWADMGLAQWDDLFLPEHHLASSSVTGKTVLVGPGLATPRKPAGSRTEGSAVAGGLAALLPKLGAQVYEHEFLICPVTGALHYTRRGRKATDADEQQGRPTKGGDGEVTQLLPAERRARQEWRLSLQVVAIRLDADQYAGAQCLAEYMNSMVRAGPLRHLRPHQRPAAGLAARMWWHYAISATLHTVRREHTNWTRIKHISSLRARYITAYAAWLSNGGATGTCPAVRALDAQLEEPTILQFRRMAHAKAGTAAKLAAQAAAQQQPGGADGGSKQPRTWVGWAGSQVGWAVGGLMGAGRARNAVDAGKQVSSGGAAVAPTAVAGGGGAGDTEAGVLGAAEWARLEEILSQQQDMGPTEAELASESPNKLRTLCMLDCCVLQLQLTRKQHLTSPPSPAAAAADVAASSTALVTIASASAYRLQVHAELFRVTRAVEVRVGAARISTPQGDMFHVGTHIRDSPKAPAAASDSSSHTAMHKDAAMRVHVIQAPQDGRADLVVSAHIAPSFVTWLPAAAAQVQAFFTPPRELELEALQAQAAVQGEAMWKLTTLRLRALSEAAARPRLDITLCAHAPKLALPHPDGHTVLLLDLGRLSLRADRALAEGLPEQEASLYDCMSANLESVAAYLLLSPAGTQFKWPHQAGGVQLQNSYLGGQISEGSAAAAAGETSGLVGTAALMNTEDATKQAQLLLDAFDTWGGLTAVGVAGGITQPKDCEPAAKQPGQPQPPSPFVQGCDVDKEQAVASSEAGSNASIDAGWDLAQLLASNTDQAGTQLVPVLDQFSMEASLQIATAVHPRYPKARVHLTCSQLHVHLSPARYHRIMICMAALTKHDVQQPLGVVPRTGGQQGTSATSAQPGGSPLPVWLSDAEHQAQVSVWDATSGAGTSKRGHWLTNRLAHVWRGRLYVTEGSNVEAVASTVYWRGRWRLMQLASGSHNLPGREHVLILAPQAACDAAAAATSAATGAAAGPDAALATDPAASTAAADAAADSIVGKVNPTAAHVKPTASAGGGEPPTGASTSAMSRSYAAILAAQPGVVVLACNDGAALSQLHAALARSRSTMQSVAGLLLDSDSSQDEDEHAHGDGEAEQGDLLARMMRHSEVIALQAHIPEVVAHLSGRTPPVITPPDLPAATSTMTPAGLVTPVAPVDAVTTTGGLQQSDWLDASEGAEGTDGEGVAAASAGMGGYNDASNVEFSLDEELPLVNVRLQAALVDMAYNGHRMHVGVAMRALTVEDKLMGACDAQLAYLAHSEAIPNSSAVGPTTLEKDSALSAPLPAPTADQQAAGVRGASDTGDEEFFDAAASWISPGTSPDTPHTTLLGRTVTDSSTLPSADPTSTQQPAQQGQQTATQQRTCDAHATPSNHTQPLVWLSYTTWAATAPNHPGVAQEVVAKLSSLTLRTHRPTVSALQAWAFDFLAVNYVLSPQQSSQVSTGVESDNEGDDVSSAGMSASVSGLHTATGTTMAAPAACAGQGPLVVMRLMLEMQKLEVVLPYEGGQYTPFARGSMDGFSFTLDMTADGMNITTQLGNLLAVCELLPETCPYRTICQLRPGDSTQSSLINVQVVSRPAAKHQLGSRAPKEGINQVYHVRATLQAVQLVYLQAVINMFNQYLFCMLSMGPISKLPPIPPATTTDASLQDTAAAAAAAGMSPSITILDIDMGAPLIIMPRNKTSTHCLELDLGRLAVHNSMCWQAAEQERWRHLMDSMLIRLWGMGIVVVQPTGERSSNCVHDLGSQGIVLQLSRAAAVAPTAKLHHARRKQPPPWPAMQAHVEVEVVDLRVSDAEYHSALGVLTGNYFETLPVDTRLDALHKIVMDQYQVWMAQMTADAERSAAGAAALTGFDEDVGLGGAKRAGSGPQKAASGHTAQTGHSKPQQAQSGGGAHTASAASSAGGGRLTRGWPHLTAGSRARLHGGHDFSRAVVDTLRAVGERHNMGVTVLLRRASLQLLNHMGASNTCQPLAKLLITDMWLSYSSSTAGGMFVQLALPVLSVHDMRPGAPTSSNLVFSTTDVATTGKQLEPSGSLSPSLMFLEYRYFKGAAAVTSLPAAGGMSTASDGQGSASAGATAPQQALQAVRVRLQQPTLVLDVAFLLPLLAFVAPQAALTGAVPTKWSSRELLLGQQPYVAQADLWLSPEVRLLADAPGVTNFTYDGSGHAIVLPAGLPATAAVPLILVGANRTLTLLNVRVVHAESMAACLQLGPGAQLVAKSEQGVELVATHRNKSSKAPRLATFDSGLGNMETAADNTLLTAGQQPAPVQSTFEMQLEAYGARLHLLDSSSGVSSSHVPVQSPAMGTNAAASASMLRAGLPPKSPSLLTTASRRALAGVGSEAMVAGGADLECIRRLVLALDLSVAGRMQGANQTWQLGLLGLSITRHTTITAIAPLHPSAPSLSGLPRAPTTALHQRSLSTGRLTPTGTAAATTTHSTYTVLKPCDLACTYTVSEPAADHIDADEEGATRSTAVAALGSTTLALDITALSFAMSPDVLQLVLTLQRSISKPLVVPPPTTPMLRCSAYERLWTTAGDAGPLPSLSVTAATLTVDSTGRGGVDPWAPSRGFALWRPQPPVGYLSLGDVPVPGAGTAPQFPVAVLAVNSGFAAWPVRFEVAWDTGDGLVLWRPIPPVGFVALGLVATSSNLEPPSTQQVACVKAQAVVETRTAQCVLLCAAGNLWNVANCGSTLMSAPPDMHTPPPTQLFDLRMPLGVAPAALIPEAELGIPATMSKVQSRADVQQADVQLSSNVGMHQQEVQSNVAVARQDAKRLAYMSRALQQRFMSSRASTASITSSDTLTAYTVEFTRLWWDRHSTASPSGCQVSLWRPVPPPGYVAVADCMVTGMYAPPQSALVLRDEVPSLSAPTSNALVVRPLGFAPVWCDEHRARLGETRYLSLWRPVPPAGYVAMGCVVHFGNAPPPLNTVKCVRADLVARVPLARSKPHHHELVTPDWINPPHRQRTALLGWLVDDATHAFVALPQDAALQQLQSSSVSGGGSLTSARLEGHKLKLPITVGMQQAQAKVGRQLHLQVRASSLSMLLQSSNKQPLLELGLQDINAGHGTHDNGVMRGFLFATAGLWSYASLGGAGVWEQLLEPWQVLAHVDINNSGQVQEGVQPGTWLRLTSTQTSVNASLSQNTTAALLLAAKEWSSALSSDATPLSSLPTQQHALLPGSGQQQQVVVEMENQLGTDIEMAVDNGAAAKEVVGISNGASHSLTYPLPVPPPSPLATSSSHVAGSGASLCLVVDVLALVQRGGTASKAGPTMPDIAHHPVAGEPDTPTLLRLSQQFQDVWAQQPGAAQQQPQSKQQLACTMQVMGPLADLMPDSCWGCSTRVVPTITPSSETAQPHDSHTPDVVPSTTQTGTSLGPQDVGIRAAPMHRSSSPRPPQSVVGEYVVGSHGADVAWNERFVVPLPAVLCEELLQHSRRMLHAASSSAGHSRSPASEMAAAAAAARDAQQWQGVPMTLKFQMVNHDRPAAPAVAAASAAVEYDWLANQVCTLQWLVTRGQHTSKHVSGATTPAAAAATAPAATTVASIAAAAAAAASQHTEQLQLSLPVQRLPSVADMQDASWLSDAELLVAISLDTQQVDVLAQQAAAVHAASQRANSGAAGLNNTSDTEQASHRLLRVPPSSSWLPLPESTHGHMQAVTERSSVSGQKAAVTTSVAFPLVGDEGAVLETGMADAGTRREVLRSLCKLVNATDVPLQASLMVGSDEAAWTLIPRISSSLQTSTPSSASAGVPEQPQQQLFEEEVFENEGFVPLRGWSHTHLLAGDRLRFNRGRAGGGDSTSFPQLPLPPPPPQQAGQQGGQQGGGRVSQQGGPQAVWEWDGAWEVETSGYVDRDGWAYGNSWAAVNYPFAPGCASRRPTDLVRRRRWVRRRVLRRRADGSAAAGTAASGSGRRRLLGVLQPGTALPLPLGWSADGNDLQLRPLLNEPEQPLQESGASLPAELQDDMSGLPRPLLLDAQGDPLHLWGVKGATNVGVSLSDLDEGSTQLLCCSINTQGAMQRLSKSPAGPAAAPDTGVSASSSADQEAQLATLLQPHWFSANVECDPLVTSQGGDVMLDWRIIARAPLRLHNNLPVAARYTVWERSGGAGGSLRARHQGVLAAWQQCAIYTVDMRQQVCLSFSPEGCEYSETEPLLLVEGVKARSLAGALGTPRLPDTFRCAYVNSPAVGAVLRLAVDRELELSGPMAGFETDILGSGASPSGTSMTATRSNSGGAGRFMLAEAVAQGAPLAVHISAPLVVVNNTQLPVSVGVMVLDVWQQGSSSMSGRVESSEQSLASGISGVRPGFTSMGLMGSTPLRIIDSDAFTQSPRPSTHINLLPRSLELMALPPGWAGVRPGMLPPDSQPAVCVSCQNSRWCAPVALPGVAMSQPSSSSAPSGNNVMLSTSDPVLLRARGRTDGLVHDLVLRFEPRGISGELTSGSPLSHVLHIDTHLVVTNRTGYPFVLVQPESWSSAPGTPATPLASGAGAAGMQAQGAPATAWTGDTRNFPSAALSIPVGAVGIPMAWNPSSTRKLLCLAMQPAGGAGQATPAPPCSDPLSMLQLPVGLEIQLLLPLIPIPGKASKASHTHHDSITDTPGLIKAGSAQHMGHACSGSQPDMPPVSQTSMIPAQTMTAFQLATAQAAALLTACTPNSDAAAVTHDTAATHQQYLLAEPCWTRMYKAGSRVPATGSMRATSSSSDAGILTEYIGVVVTLQLVPRAPGCLSLELLSLGAEPAHLVQNSTTVPMAFREHAPRCPWQRLPELSAVGYVRRDLGSLSAQPALELELSDMDNLGAGAGHVISFDSCMTGGSTLQSTSAVAVSGSSSGSTISAAAQPTVTSSAPGHIMLKLGQDKLECSAQVSVLRDLMMSSSGPQGIRGTGAAATSPAGMGGGAGRADLLLLVSPLQRHDTTWLDNTRGMTPAINAPTLSTHYILEVSGLEISLLDDRPQELLCASLDGLLLEYHTGCTGGQPYSQLLLKVHNVQVDDELPTSPYPVMLLPLDAQRHDSTGASKDPLLYASYVVKPGKRRDGLYYPCLTFRLLPLRLAVAEGTLWQLVACLNALYKLAQQGTDDEGHITGTSRRSRSSSGSMSGGPALTSAEGQHAVQTELPLVLNFLNLEDMQLSFSFKPDPASRRIANQLLSLSLDLVALEDLRVDLPGLHIEGSRRIQKSTLTQMVQSQIQQRLMGMIFSILTNAGVLGSTSKILAVASQGMAQLTDTRGSTGQAAGSSSTGREVGNLGEGMLEGGKAIAKGVLAGAVGILAKPVEGAERGGISGFFEGVTKGVAGVVVNPLSGFVAAAAKVTEGMDATYGSIRDTMMWSAPRRGGRKRLPRAIKGNGVLEPYSLHAALGQALMHNSSLPAATTSGLNWQVLSRLTGIKGPGSTGKAARGRALALSAQPLLQDCYQEHFLLPNEKVAGLPIEKVVLLTNKRVACIHAPEFVKQQQRVLSGEATHVTDMSGGIIEWWVTWDALLTAELAWHQQQAGMPADGVLIHRKERSPIDNMLVHTVRCTPGTSQAQQLLTVLLSTWYRYRLQPRVPELSASPYVFVTAQERAVGQAAPDSLISLDWRLVWYSTASKSAALSLGPLSRAPSFQRVSIWRPVGPAGYCMLGDVVVVGTEAPLRPAQMYRDAGMATSSTVTAEGDAPGEGARLTPPQSYSLVFRDSAQPTLTLWRPVPRKGYVDVGCVAWPATEEPPLGLVRCVRKDLVVPATTTSERPIWMGASHDNQFWRASIWPVHNQAMTFVAVKGDAKPRQAFAPVY